MASLLNADGEHVLLSCTCSALSPLTRLYFCRHCIKLRCQLCVSHEVDSYYCPNCLENMPSAEAKLKKNRCANCFDCPSCGNTLSTRATAVAIPSEDKKTPPQAKKVYYLACGFCRWSSRDVNMEDRTVASGGWPDPENPSAKRIGTLVDFYRQLAQKEKVEREKKKLSKRRNYMHLAFTPKKKKDRLGMSSLSRRKSSLSYLTAHLGKGKEMEDVEIVLKEPSKATEDVETLPEEFYTLPLFLERVPHISQRLANPDLQPTGIKSLHTRHKHLLAKRSQRCRECEHNLSKPEFNPSSIKFKIQLGSAYYVPRLRIAQVPSLFYNQEAQITLSMTNPVESIVKVTLHSYEKDDDEDDENKKNEDSKENSENEKNNEKKGEEIKNEKNEKIEENSVKEEKDEPTEEKKGNDGKENKSNADEEKGASETAEQEKDAKNKRKTDSLVSSALFDRKTERRVDNRCESRAFVPTAEVVLPTCALALGARDEAAEFDDSDTTAELFSDDPRVVADRQANKLWFYVKVTPKKPVGDVKFSMIMQYDYKHTTSTLIKGGQEPETRIETQRHKIHINLGPVEGATDV
ncbi:dynactin subunit 4-like [Actinia tenebrosa]|uniref:Dynactin subunit 4 n=1 Tax=Actinia tenebrosa TaxID=6105 RepID=A0A6P8J7X7_ACTTE|nr:dynactin subunit 4-like [Actinia tenebrosa]